jgi:hypothetical protein
MRDYWLTQYILSAIGWGYLIVVLIVLALVIWLVKGKAAKTISLVVVLGLASVLPLQGYQEYEKEKVAADAYRVRLAKAQVFFDERCKTAGEKIYRTVENVEGVLLAKLRPEKVNFSSQFVMDDPYGRDLGGEGYISSFLRVPSESTGTESQGYLFIDTKDQSGKLTRYELVRKTSAAGVPYTVLDEIQNVGKVANFSIDYEDISTQTDREHWIAGGRLQITDMNTKQLVAERTGYIFDRGLGNVDGGRGPWEAAVPCGKDDRQYGHTARFVMKSIKPISGK